MTVRLLEKLDWTEPESQSARIGDMTGRLAALDGAADDAGGWPDELWSVVERGGATRWSLPQDFGGESCARPLLVQRYAQLAGGSLTAVFILSQHDAAVRRLMAAPADGAAAGWLRFIGEGRAFTTVGISHLTTSRRLGPQAIKVTKPARGGYQLDGTIPWVTAAVHADVFVTGAVLDDGRQMLIALPADRPGINVSAPFPLAALQASCTSEVVLDGVHMDDSDLLAGPALDISAQPGAVGTAGLETSALALGLARAALAALGAMAPDHVELAEPLEVLCERWQVLWGQLMAQARGEADTVPASEIRTQANALVLRATQAYLTAKKGTGFLRSEPAQRWARQALFFLVWSCPTPVAQAAIRSLAGLCQA
jgi:alkylation response protein AidB-like acyl-CoA dehydrogenase